MHIAVYGTGRVGRPTAFAVLLRRVADEITVCDIKPNLARAVRNDLAHAAAGYHDDVKLYYADRDEDVSGADMVIVTAGFPRPQGVHISRRDLASKNASIVRQVAEASRDRNPRAKYVVVTNPVDSMAMICHRFTEAPFVISTGTNLETQRLRAVLSEKLCVPVSGIQGWVGGEHGEKAVVLWSTVKINGLTFDEKVAEAGLNITKDEVSAYIKAVSESIVDGLGATEYGPAASFSRIVHAILRNTDEVLSIATPKKLPGFDEDVWVSAPTRMGRVLDASPYEALTEAEKGLIADAARAILETYRGAYQTVASA